MDIMALGAIGELVGGVAVIGSLLFVGIQLRHSNHLARADAELEVGRMNMDYMRLLAESEVPSAYSKCYFAPETANHEERWRFTMAQGMWIHMIQAMYRQYQRGLLPEASWEPLALTLAR